MKKRIFASLFLLLPLALCAACGGGVQRTEISTNWYRNTALGNDIAGTNETLEYAVSVTDPTPHNGLSADYSGVYTMTLVNASVTLDNSTKEGYVLETSLSVSVTFTYEGKSTAALNDTVTSRVEFLPVGDNLKPVSSTKTAHTHVPNDAPQSVETAYTEYHYTYAVEYDDALTTASVTYTDHLPDREGKVPRPVKSEIDIGGKTTYLDNEQILFALRGMNVSSALTFRSINPTMGTVQNVGLRQAGSDVTEAVSFERNGEPFSSDALAATEFRVGYGNNIGQGCKIIMAKKTSNTDNEYRNVPLRMEYPLIRSLGTLRYTLVKATFANK